MTVADIDPTDLPFLPPENRLVVLDLPVPPSVNKSRRVDWAGRAHHKKWLANADKCVMAAKCRSKEPISLRQMPGQFEVRIIVDERQTNIDLDNGTKALIDFLHRIELVVDDSKKYLRKYTVEWGIAPTGVRMIIRELTS